MNEDVFAGQWRELKGTLRSWWGNLSEDDFEWIGGQKDRLVGLLQQKYGWTREQAQEDVDRRLSEYDEAGDGLREAKEKSYRLGETAANKAREVISSAADGLDSATSYMKENDFSAMAADVRDLVRKYPFQSVLIGAGLAYLLFRRH